MIKQIKSKKASRFYARVVSLLVITALLITSSSAVIAIETYRAARTLSEQTFTLNPEDGVTVTLSGLLPTNGYAEAKPAEQASDEGVLHAYDITIRYANGDEFEPADDQPISVGFESAAIASAIADKSTSLEVEHITDSGEVEKVDLSFAEDNTAGFIAGSFSVYLIRENPTAEELATPRKTFWFLDSVWSEYTGNRGDPEHIAGAFYISGLYKFPNNAGEMVSTQTVKNGEKLHPIVMPENYEWGSFYGWYIVELDLEKSQQETAKEIGGDPSSITKDKLTQFVYKWTENPTLITHDTVITVDEDEDTDVYLAPYYSRYRFVNFRDHEREGDEASNIVARKLLVLGNNASTNVDISDVTADSPDAQSKVFYGWKYKNQTYQTRRATGEVIQKSITVTRDDLGEDDHIDVYAVFKDAAWLYFVHGENGWNAQYVGAIFAYLYDPEVPENERVCIEQLPSTTRPGYIFDGWYTGHMDNGHIVYEQQVSMPLVDASVTGSSSIITTAGGTIPLTEDGKTYISMGKLYLRQEMTLYAKWRPVNSADYKVVIWKQKVSDSKNATDAEKTYDYHSYVLMEDQPSGSVILDSQAYQNQKFEDMKNSPDATERAKFDCFHYSRTEVVVNGNTYNGDIPSQRVKGVVAPDSSTVVNVYYDRDLMAINFYYTNDFKNDAPAAAVTESYVYTAAISSTSTVFGVVNDNYVQLTKKTTPSEYYVFRYEYIQSAEDDFGDNQFGVVGDEYVPLVRTLDYKWMKTGGYYLREQGTPSSSKTYVGIVGGSLVSLSYSYGYWRYRGNYGIQQQYTGDFYYEAKTGGETGEYTGDRYILNGSKVMASTSDSPATQYAQDAQGNLYELNRVENGATYSYNNTPYTGTRYERTEYKRTYYDGTHYKKTSSGFVETTDESGTLYGRRSATSPYEEIIKKTETVTTYTYDDNGTAKTYDGILYARSRNYDYEKRLTWTGLYGQTLVQNDYNWDDVRDIVWRETTSTTAQTLLEGFMQKSNPYNLYSLAENTTSIVRHYRQSLNADDTIGNYVYNDAVEVHYNQKSATFNFSNKFNGFTVAGYTLKNNFSETGAGINPQGPGTSVQHITFPLHVYHTRNTYTLTLMDYSTDNNSPGQPNDRVIEGVPFEAHVKTYMSNHNYLTPPERVNYTFGGWYVDAALTKPAKLDKITMPAENMALYAKWDLKYYFVEIDPNGGEMEDQTEFTDYTGITSARKQSTYTWLRYGTKLSEYANVERTYVPDNNGEYVYVNVKFAPTFQQACTKDWDLSLPSRYRAAFYCKLSELQSVYNEHFAGLKAEGTDDQLITWEEFSSYCVDNSHKYRKANSNEGYTLVAWYKVNDDGTTSNEMYNFSDTVTKPTRIRAVWRKTGEYYVEYNPYMRRYNIGEYVTKNGETYHNPIHYDPFDPNDPTQISDRYLDEATATIRTAPEHIPEYYVFKGWQLLRPDGSYADVAPYSPGETFMISSEYADRNGLIRFEACYEPEKESTRIVDTAALILDANTGVVQKNGLDIYDENKIYVDLNNEQVLFHKQPANFEVKLEDYYDNFLHEDGYVLIGWNKTPDKQGYEPDFAADAIIGVDNENVDDDHPNILYAVWEPMLYLTLENHSTEYNVTFDLQFTGNGENNTGKVYCYAGEDEDPYHRHLLSEGDHDNILVERIADNHFRITLIKAESADKPNAETLVLPDGVNAHYYVSGRITTTNESTTDSSLTGTGTVRADDGRALNRSGVDMSIYNSGGAGEKLVRNGSSYNGVYSYKNLNGTTTKSYSVNGAMKLGREGQKVAFYTGETQPVSVQIAAAFYDPQNNQWKQETDTVRGPEATLHFDKGELVGTETSDGHGITGLNIIQGEGKTFGIKMEGYTNTTYKFIGWYDEMQAAPADIPIDGEGTPPNEIITGLTVPNNDTIYYALFVPLADGNLTISHDEKQTSIGYPKKMVVQAVYPDANNVQQTAEDYVITHIKTIAERNGHKEHTQVVIPVRESDSDKTITITLGAMSGYGSVYGNTYEGLDMLSRSENTDSHRFDESEVVAVVYSDPDQTDITQPYDPTAPIGSGETKHLYQHILVKNIGDLFENSETVKGYKVLRDLKYESDFTRKYEFIYNYKFRDGTTQRRYSENGNTAVYTTEAAFKDFVAENAPYTTNFGEELIWDYSTIRIENLEGKGRIIANMDAIQNPKMATVLVKTEGSGITIPRQVPIGETFPIDDMPTAEKIMGDKQFYRWKIANTTDGSLIGYCYWYEFTFMVWQNITITAEYVPLKEDGEYHRYMPDDEQSAYITIQHLDSTRNRWVKLDENDEIIRGEKDLPIQYYDNLIDDYSILYVDHGLRINNHAENYKVGLIYEIVGEIADESIPEAYTTKPNDTLRGQAIDFLLEHPEKTTGAINYQNKPKFYYSQFDPAELTHDNRIEFYRGIDNLKKDGVLHPNAKYVFNVYAYMQTPDKQVIQSEPVTLQLYRLAVETTAH